MLGYCSVEVNVRGPHHSNVDPGGAVVVRFNIVPEHTGELLPSTGTGTCFTTTGRDALLVQFPNLVVTEYVPVDNVSSGFAINGFCSEELNPDGPVHAKLTPGVIGLQNKNNVSPSHTGAFDVSIGTAGVLSITTFTVPLSVHPFSVVTTVYTPE